MSLGPADAAGEGSLTFSLSLLPSTGLQNKLSLLQLIWQRHCTNVKFLFFLLDDCTIQEVVLLETIKNNLHLKSIGLMVLRNRKYKWLFFRQLSSRVSEMAKCSSTDLVRLASVLPYTCGQHRHSQRAPSSALWLGNASDHSTHWPDRHLDSEVHIHTSEGPA